MDEIIYRRVKFFSSDLLIHFFIQFWRKRKRSPIVTRQDSFICAAAQAGYILDVFPAITPIQSIGSLVNASVRLTVNLLVTVFPHKRCVQIFYAACVMIDTRGERFLI